MNQEESISSTRQTYLKSNSQTRHGSLLTNTNSVRASQDIKSIQNSFKTPKQIDQTFLNK